MKQIIAIAVLAIATFAIRADAQTFGGVQTNFTTIQCPTNSGPVWTNVLYYGLPTKTLVLTNLWGGQSNFIASWVKITPAQTNIITISLSFVGYTNNTFSTNVSFYGPETNIFLMSASPGTNNSGVFYTNGIYVN